MAPDASVTMFVMDVREVGMAVGQRLVCVRMRVRLPAVPGEGVLVTVMVVVHV